MAKEGRGAVSSKWDYVPSTGSTLTEKKKEQPVIDWGTASVSAGEEERDRGGGWNPLAVVGPPVPQRLQTPQQGNPWGAVSLPGYQTVTRSGSVQPQTNDMNTGMSLWGGGTTADQNSLMTTPNDNTISAGDIGSPAGGNAIVNPGGQIEPEPITWLQQGNPWNLAGLGMGLGVNRPPSPFAWPSPLPTTYDQNIGKDMVELVRPQNEYSAADAIPMLGGYTTNYGAGYGASADTIRGQMATQNTINDELLKNAAPAFDWYEYMRRNRPGGMVAQQSTAKPVSNYTPKKSWGGYGGGRSGGGGSYSGATQTWRDFLGNMNWKI